MDKRFKPRAGRFGVEQTVAGVTVQANITASATTPIYMSVAFRKAVIGRCSVSAGVLPIGGGAITATFIKYSKSGVADVVLTAAQDITVGALVAKQNKLVPLLTTLTDAQIVLLEGDTIRVDVIAASTVSTQPSNLAFAVELLVQE